MGFFNFKKNPNETAYVGGKKHWADVIKYTGLGGDLVWRQPEEDFNTNSTLVVMPGEQAVFINAGNIEAVFQSGTYKLSTNNYPFISRLRNSLTGGISTFNCVVYFVRSASSIEVQWGTNGPVQVRDKVIGIETKITANGAYKITIGDAGKFLTKMLGNGINSMSPLELKKYFGQEFCAEIKTSIAEYVNNSDWEVIGIAGHQREIAAAVEPYISEALEEYGIKLLKFSISAIEVDDNEFRRDYDRNKLAIRKAEADKEIQKLLGSNWMDQQKVDIMKDASKNGGASDGAAIGLGLALGRESFDLMRQDRNNQSSRAEDNSPRPLEPPTRGDGDVPPPPRTPALKQYYTYVGNQQIGPISENQLQTYIDSGMITRDSSVWCQGMPTWASADSVPQIAALFTTPPPMPPRR